MKRRTLPSLSRRWGLSAGKLVSISVISWGRFWAEDCISLVPLVCFWNAFGNTTLTDINFLSILLDSIPLNEGLKISQTRTNRLLLFVLALKHIQGLQTVAGDGHHGQIARSNPAVGIKASRDRGGYASGGFGEDTFGFGQFLDRGNDLHVGNILSPATTFVDGADGVWAVGRIADGQRTRNRSGPLRLVVGQTVLHGVRDGRTARGLRAEKAHVLLFDQAELDQLAKGFADLRNQGAP